MDEQMNNNGYQSQPNPMPNQNKDNYAVEMCIRDRCTDMYMIHTMKFW